MQKRQHPRLPRWPLKAELGILSTRVQILDGRKSCVKRTFAGMMPGPSRSWERTVLVGCSTVARKPNSQHLIFDISHRMWGDGFHIVSQLSDMHVYNIQSSVHQP